MDKLESVLEKESHEFLWDFKIQTDHPISARKSTLVLINKKKRTCQLVVLAVAADNIVKILLGSCQRTENAVEDGGDTHCNRCTWKDPQKVRKTPEDTRNQQKNRNIQTLLRSVRIHKREPGVPIWGDLLSLSAWWKTHREWNIYNNLHNRLVGLVGRVSANGPGDLDSIPGCVIPKTLKM